MSKFYNPGFAWKETLKYDNPVGDPREVNLISYYVVEAPEAGFFEVKDTTVMKLPTGEEYEIPLRFKELVRTSHAEHGVVLIAPGRKCTEEENIAGTDEEAKKKGNTIWRNHARDKANEWLRIVHETKASGQIPRAATGTFKRFLELCGVEDPADQAGLIGKAKEDQKSNQDLQSQMAELLAKLNRLEGAQNAKRTS